MYNSPLYHFVFCRKHRTVYCPVPKAACSSWKEYFRRLEGLPEAKTLDVIHGRRINGLTYAWSIDPEELLTMLISKQYFRFTVVRNPYARLVSAYEDLIKPDKKNQARGNNIVDGLRHLLCVKRDIRFSDLPTLSFADFIEAVSLEKPVNMDRHWQPQTLLTRINILKFDKVVKLENLKSEAGEITERIGAGAEMAIHKNRARRRRNIQPYFTDELQETVKEIYAMDFRRFDYCPDSIPD